MVLYIGSLKKRGNMMKIIENLILKACGYSSAILFLFYLAGTVADFTNPYINFKTFLFIALFGVVISIAELVLKVEKIHIFLRILIHYLALFCAFTVIFIISGNIAVKGPASIFSALIIFTVLYAVIFSALYFIRKAIKTADSKIDKKNTGSTGLTKKSQYKSLYKED